MKLNLMLHLQTSILDSHSMTNQSLVLLKHSSSSMERYRDLELLNEFELHCTRVLKLIVATTIHLFQHSLTMRMTFHCVLYSKQEKALTFQTEFEFLGTNIYHYQLETKSEITPIYSIILGSVSF